jgi:hypothetical protein
MSIQISDDEQRKYCLASPMNPMDSGGGRASVALPLLDDIHRHRLRYAAWHLSWPGQEPGSSYSERLLGK